MRRLLKLEQPSIRWLLKDDFSDTLAAGSVNGTLSYPGPGTRTVVDTENKLSISGGKLTFSGGKASPGWTDPCLRYAGQNRVAGKIYIVRLSPSAGSLQSMFGLGNVNSTAYPGTRIQFSAGNIQIMEAADGSGGSSVVGSYAALEYCAVIVNRAVGSYMFISGGLFSYPTLLFQYSSMSDATIYPKIHNLNATTTVDFLRIPQQTWLPTPEAYAAWGASGAITSTDATGPDGQGSPVRSWIGGTNWSVTGGFVANSPVAGANVVTNGTFDSDVSSWSQSALETFEWSAGKMHMVETGTSYSYAYQDCLTAGAWYLTSGTLTLNSGATIAMEHGTGSATAYSRTTTGTSTATFHAAGTRLLFKILGGAADWLVDDVVVTPLTLSDLITTTSCGTANVHVKVPIHARTTSTQAGICINVDSTSNPQNGIFVYMDGTNLKTEQLLAGVWSTLNTTAKAFTVDAALVVDSNGTAVRVYYNNVFIVEVTKNAAITGTQHGLFSTYSANQFGAFQAFAKGNEGQYSSLDKFTR